MNQRDNDNRRDLDSPEPEINQQLERFLDQQMSPAEAEQFANNTEDSAQLDADRQLDSEITSAIVNVFGRTANSNERLAKLVTDALETNSNEQHQSSLDDERLAKPLPAAPQEKHRLNRRWIQAALAACLLFALIQTWSRVSSTQDRLVAFMPRNLTAIYTETQTSGFRPYYNCEDMDRFASTFEKRLEKRLTLTEMPDGIRMLGLSYPGGISRQTTAMLGEVSGEQVMVFVDRVENQETLKSVAAANDSSLNVFTRTKDGLIFAEVTPHATPTLIDYFEFLDPTE